jgi:hypothetical protein
MHPARNVRESVFPRSRGTTARQVVDSSRPYLYGLCDLAGKFCASAVRSRVVTNNGELQCHEERKISRKAHFLRRPAEPDYGGQVAPSPLRQRPDYVGQGRKV